MQLVKNAISKEYTTDFQFPFRDALHSMINSKKWIMLERIKAYFVCETMISPW